MNNIYKIIENDKVRITIKYDLDAINPRYDYNLGSMICFHSRYKLGDPHPYDDPRDFLEKIALRFLNLSANIEEKKSNRIFVHNASDDELFNVIKEHAVILPLYLYDHSGLSIRTTPFSCPWDSGQVGWIYCSKEKFLKETMYTKDELFSQDPNRLPAVGERVKIKGHEDRGFAQVISADENGVYVDWDYNKVLSYRNPTNQGYFKYGEIAEVMNNMAVKILNNEVIVYDQYLQGDVYGYTVETKTFCPHCGGVTYQVEDSCWGFYGTNFLKNGLIDAIPKEYQEMVMQELGY